jgi:hypothetical protein
MRACVCRSFGASLRHLNIINGLRGKVRHGCAIVLCETQGFLWFSAMMQPEIGASSEITLCARESLEVPASRIALFRDALAGRNDSLNKFVNCGKCFFRESFLICPLSEVLISNFRFHFRNIVVFSEFNSIALEPSQHRIGRKYPIR